MKDTNRAKKTQARRTKFWCGGCDANLVSPGSKCKVCGSKMTSKRAKKIAPMIEEQIKHEL